VTVIGQLEEPDGHLTVAVAPSPVDLAAPTIGESTAPAPDLAALGANVLSPEYAPVTGAGVPVAILLAGVYVTEHEEVFGEPGVATSKQREVGVKPPDGAVKETAPVGIFAGMAPLASPTEAVHVKFPAATS
jgi:hypothetical protein